MAGVSCCVLLLAYDLRRFVLPTWLNVLLGLSGLLFHWQSDFAVVSASELAASAFVGPGILYALRWAYLRFRNVEALGLGDVKFMAAAGLWIGAWNVALLLAIASLATLLALGCLRMLQIIPTPLRGQRVPFGPGLCIALVIVAGDMLVGYPWPPFLR